MAARTLEVRNFAQIEKATIAFGDLTVLVGPQGAGKSLLLQLWKLALDAGEIVTALRSAGRLLANNGELLDAYFGEGMRSAWSNRTVVRIDGKALNLDAIRKAPAAEGTAFFVPAHRALLMT